MRYGFALLVLALSLASSKDKPQSLRDSTLPQSDRLAIQHRLQRDTARFQLTEDEILSTRIQAIDLNEDDIPEILAQCVGSSCGATGNCTFWILQKKGTDYKILLKSVAKEFRTRTIKTGGFADIELGRHDSAYRTEWRGYKFDGTHYVKVKCWASVAGDSEHDKPYAKPKIEPCK